MKLCCNINLQTISSLIQKSICRNIQKAEYLNKSILLLPIDKNHDFSIQKYSSFSKIQRLSTYFEQIIWLIKNT